MPLHYKNDGMLGDEAGSFTGSRSLFVPGKRGAACQQHIGA